MMAAEDEVDLVVLQFQNYTVQQWSPSVRDAAIAVLKEIVEEDGWSVDLEGLDRDMVTVGEHYQKDGKGEFWVVKKEGKVVGTCAYQVLDREALKLFLPTMWESLLDVLENTVRISRLCLLPEARGQGLGHALLEVGSILARLAPRPSPCLSSILARHARLAPHHVSVPS